MSIQLEPIAYVHSSRKELRDDDWDGESVYLQLTEDLSEESLQGLAEFSHVEIIFFMDKVEATKIERTARHPRNNPSWPKVGIFAQRGKNRPNQLGTTICRIKRVQGRCLHLEGLDAVDGTPVLDIKPWVQEFAPRGQVYQPQWITELMRGYWHG